MRVLGKTCRVVDRKKITWLDLVTEKTYFYIRSAGGPKGSVNRTNRQIQEKSFGKPVKIRHSPAYGKDDEACICHWPKAGKAHAEDDSESGYRTFSRRFPSARARRRACISGMGPARVHFFFGPKHPYRRA